MNERVRITSAVMLIVAALLLVLTVLPLSSAATVFTNNVQLTSANVGNDQFIPQIALDSKGKSHITWEGYNPTTGAPLQIWYTDNTSGAWAAPTQLTSATGSNHQFSPQIALDSKGKSHITWEGYNPTTGGAEQIWYADNTSGAWATTQLTSANVGNHQSNPQIELDSNRKSHITWFGYNPTTGAPRQIWYADNTSGAWATTQLTSANVGNDQFNPQIALDSNRKSHITWFGYNPTTGGACQIWYADNTSGAWAAPTQLTSANIGSNQYNPQIALDSNRKSHITWEGFNPTTGAPYQIWYADNTSGAWAAPTQLTSANVGNDQQEPQIAVDSNRKSHITWYGFNPTTGAPLQIWYADNTSGAWATPTQLTSANGSNHQSVPQIAVDPNRKSHITWFGYNPTTGAPRQIWYADNTSGAWAAPTQLTSATGSNDQVGPQIAVDSNGKSHITWFGYNPTTGAPFQIWYSSAVGPTVKGLSPASGTDGMSVLPVTVTGSNFQSGATLMLTGPDQIGPVSTTGSGNTLKATLNLTGKALGSYTAKVTNPNLISASKSGAFTVKSTASTWYLAEGSTAYGFDCYITIENPNTTAVTANITYMTGSGAINASSVNLPPKSQATINPADKLGNQDFSTRVVSKQGKAIAVDRTMSWTGTGAPSPEAHSSIGVTSPAKTWYLPEGSSAWGFECWLLIQNPNKSEAKCSVTYMIEGQGPRTVSKSVPANSRKTFNMADDIGARDASIKVTSSIPVIPERAMYRNSRREGHDSIGTTSPAKDFYLAEGTSAWGFTTYVLIQNPNNVPSDVTVTYMTPGGPKPQAPLHMDPNSRKTIRVNDVAGVQNTDFSTRVHGTKPIIAERSMYWGADTPLGEACHDSVGMASAHSSFYLPDGQTSEGRETWTLIQNPNSSPVTVQITYMTPSGKGNVVFTDAIGANSRKTYNMADKGISERAAVMVTSKTKGKKIMVERAMYWNARGAGTDTIGGYSD